MRNEINADIKEAFDTDLKDAVKPFVGNRKTHIESIESWIENDVSENIENYTGRGVFTGYEASETINQSVLQGDVKLICLQSEISSSPSMDDIISCDGVDYRVIFVQKDAANVTYTVQLRRE